MAELILTAVGAVTGVTSGATGIASVLSSLVPLRNAQRTLEVSHKSMRTKKLKLLNIKESIEKYQLLKYWFQKRNQNKQWISAVEIIIAEVEELEENFIIISDISSVDIPSRAALTHEIDVKCTTIDEAIKDGNELEVALKSMATRIINQCPDFSIEKILSLNKKLKDLLKFVKSDTCNTFRVEGVTGTGKTILMQHLNNHTEVRDLFDIVIWIPSLDFEKYRDEKSTRAGIQHTVAGRLGIFATPDEDENAIATKISGELDGAKYLLLLDDVKVEINLERIGIPANTQGRKIVYTTNIRVYPFGVPPHHQFLTECMKKLTFDESWQIFEDILLKHNPSVKRPDIMRIARLVVQSCGGLISIIYLVAQSCKSKKSEKSWVNALNMLQVTPKKEDIPMEGLEKFFSFSYGTSLDEWQQKCFLFCILYPEKSKIPIHCLFDCWAANNLIQDHDLDEDILDHLVKMALLEKVANKPYVTIKNRYRRAAMKILKQHKELTCLVAAEANTRLQNSDCKDICWISLANSGIDVLPSMVVDSSKVTTLFVQKNSKLNTDLSSFIKDEKNTLLVLDLYKTGLESALPMSHLKMLKVLYVNDCSMLKEFPFKIDGPDNNSLEVLDIRGWIINEIPPEIKRLKNLRRLLVSIRGIDCHTMGELKIEELSKLSELIIDVKSKAAYQDGNSHMPWNKVIETILEKIDSWKELTALQFHFEDKIVDVIQVCGGTLRIFVPDQCSLKYIWKIREERRKSHTNIRVYIGFEMTTLEIPEVFSSFVLSCDKIVSDAVTEDLLLTVKAVIMMNESSMEHLDQIEVSHTNIHHCMVQGCNKIETLMQVDNFSKLKTLVLSKCSQLKVLFPDNVLQQVMCIEHLEIKDCPTIEEINMLSTSLGEFLPKLRKLVLHELPKLKKICSDMKWRLMTTLEIHNCPELKELPLNIDREKDVLTMKVEKIWWEELQLGREIKLKLEELCIFSYSVPKMPVCQGLSV